VHYVFKVNTQLFENQQLSTDQPMARPLLK